MKYILFLLIFYPFNLIFSQTYPFEFPSSRTTFPLYPIPTNDFLDKAKENKIKKITAWTYVKNDSTYKYIEFERFFVWEFNKDGSLHYEVLLGDKDNKEKDLFVKYFYKKRSNQIISKEMTDAGYHIKHYYLLNNSGQIIKEKEISPCYKVFTDYIYEDGLLTKKIYSDSAYDSVSKSGIDSFFYNNNGKVVYEKNNVVKDYKEYNYDTIGRLIRLRIISNRDTNEVFTDIKYAFENNKIIIIKDFSYNGDKKNIKTYTYFYLFDKNGLLTEIFDKNESRTDSKYTFEYY